MSKYETIAGQVTHGETFSKLLHHLKEAEDCCYVIAHLHRTETSRRDELLATGWRGVGQMLALVRAKSVNFAKGTIY